MTVHVRGSSSAGDLIAAVRAEIRALDSSVPVLDAQTLADQARSGLVLYEAAAAALTAFGLIAICLAAVGVYGVLAYAVRLRTREIGIRVALGAPARDVRRLVLRQGLALTGIGLATGFLGAYLLAPVIDRLLISMPATDPVTFVGTALLLTTTTLLACYLPARRATRVDPILTLKNE